jgi:hypothetical protein
METDPESGGIDLTEADTAYYSASVTPELVEIGPVLALGIEGRGEPGGGAHVGAIQSLYGVADHIRSVAAGSCPDAAPSRACGGSRMTGLGSKCHVRSGI